MSVWPILQDWAEFFLRWLHVVAAIFWIGLALGFLRLNLTLKSTGAAVWRADDDGYFRITHETAAPADAQPQIGWFRWEAYVAWLSGFALMAAHYFLQADLYLIDPRVLPLAPWQAIAIAVLVLVLSWPIYDGLAKAPWSETARRLAILAFFVALAFALTRAFSGRGAFLELGAVLGTIMAANVAHVLVPNQRKTLAAIRGGQAPDEARLAASRQRALHNNYLALPVLFLMLSNHYPLAFAGRFNWLVAAFALVAGAAVRHFFIARHRGEGNLWWTWAAAGVAGVAMLGLSLAGADRPQDEAAAPRDAMEALTAAVAPRFAEVEDVVAQRCAICHARSPAWPSLVAPPKGVLLDSAAHIRSRAKDIGLQAVWTSAMPPPGSGVDLPEEDRRTLALWLAAGAPAD